MKKWMVLTIGSLLSTGIQAAPAFCNYKDFFRISDTSHPGIYVVSGYNEPDVNLQIVGPRSFVIRDTPACKSGYAHVTVAYSNQSWCVLDIKDGPYMMHPKVQASCNGMRYLGKDYDGFGSYSYTLNFE